MSKFLDNCSKYSRTYNLCPVDRLKLFLHYPLVKLYWISRAQEHSRVGKIAAAMLRPMRSYRIWNELRPANGRVIKVPISFAPGGFGSFQEIFWKNEYSLPVEIDGVHTIVDLGANAGLASLYFLARYPTVRRLVLVEPNPALIPPMKSLYDQFDGVHIDIENCCISDSVGEVSFSVRKDDRFSLMGSGNGCATVTVRSRPLSHLLDQLNIGEVDLLKLDIEGAEYPLMEADAPVFRRFRHIVAELHCTHKDQERFCQKLKDQGFNIYPVRPFHIFASRAA